MRYSLSFNHVVDELDEKSYILPSARNAMVLIFAFWLIIEKNFSIIFLLRNCLFKDPRTIINIKKFQVFIQKLK